MSTLGLSLQQSAAEEAKSRLDEITAATKNLVMRSPGNKQNFLSFFLWMGRRVTGRGQQYEELTNRKLLLSWLHAKVTVYFCFLF